MLLCVLVHSVADSCGKRQPSLHMCFLWRYLRHHFLLVEGSELVLLFFNYLNMAGRKRASPSTICCIKLLELHLRRKGWNEVTGTMCLSAFAKDTSLF